MTRIGDGSDNGPVVLDVLVLPAFGGDDFELPSAEGDDSAAAVPNELERWFDADDFEDQMAVRGANAPVFYTDDGLGLTATGMGKADAATTVAALLASPALDLSETYFVTAGVAGAPPSAATLGAVFVADAVVDWDRKHRWATDEPDQEKVSPVELLRYRPRDYAFRLNEDLVERAVSAAESVDLRDSEEARAYCQRYDEEAAQSSPFVGRGATVCGDEFWHGTAFSEQAEWLAEAYDAGRYVTAEMEDFGTATALARFGALERYLSVRGVVNFDQPPAGASVEERLDEDGGGFALELALENAFRVASAVVDDLRV